MYLKSFLLYLATDDGLEQSDICLVNSQMLSHLVASHLLLKSNVKENNHLFLTILITQDKHLITIF